MQPLKLPKTRDKQVVFQSIIDYLEALDITVASTDFSKPWGGYFVIDSDSIEQFIVVFFPAYSYDSIAGGLPLTPKILVVTPGKRLSWQYHNRREEIWSVVAGPVGVMKNNTDEQSSVSTVGSGQTIQFEAEERHRLNGLAGFGVVAEFWKHTDPDNPSDEDDIVRVQDDFNRAA